MRVAAPVLLIHGTADTIVSHRESVRMHDALTAAGKPAALLVLEGAPHAFQAEWRSEATISEYWMSTQYEAARASRRTSALGVGDTASRIRRSCRRQT